MKLTMQTCAPKMFHRCLTSEFKFSASTRVLGELYILNLYVQVVRYPISHELVGVALLTASSNERNTMLPIRIILFTSIT